MRTSMAHEVPSPGQRALWSFLMITLVAPFLAAVVIFLASVIAGAVGRGPASLIGLDQAGQLGWAAKKAVSAYVWSAIPAGVAGAIVAAFVWTGRSTPWLVRATIGAVTATVFAALAGGIIAGHVAPVAFIGALVGIAMGAILKRAGIAS